ncbi:helicase swr-1 [Magnaporthiopsis poae ATCC 64411]|uniref:DNA helicase n=1 Tax=Magnaporthiopsis poae (strain ATCC 64411 / 73-15) TaxID=644358 RepID=A0A0C4DKE8_MAGP6|nr:helicase swr-1 [Magnaporthiopsis poae ATCC 64411]
MTGTASPVPPRPNSDAVDNANGQNGHLDDARPSTPDSEIVDTLIIPDPPEPEPASAPSPSESSLSDPLSEPPSDDELVPPSPSYGHIGHTANDTSDIEPAAPGRDDDAQPDGQDDDDDDGEQDGERPAKRRRVRDYTPPPRTRKPKLESPPWKKIEAEGPTTFVEEGKRRSGRINSIPPELQNPVKRAAKPKKSRLGPQLSPPSKKKPASTNVDRTPGSDVGRSGGSRAAPRIKLHVMPATMPFIHPAQAKSRPKLGPTFEEYFEASHNIPVEEGGQLCTDDAPRLTDEAAAEEAVILNRIEKEAEEDGLLSEARCSIYAPEAVDEPPRQWAHADHMVKALANFRKLMLMEQQRHRATARKLAEACRDEWLRKQPKTAEELEQEAQELWKGTYFSVARALFGTWENVKFEINRRRLEEWEAEEQRRVKAALQEAVQISEQKLQARRAHADSDGMTDDDSGIERSSEEEDSDEDDEMISGLEDTMVDSGAASEEEDEDNMSSSGDDEDAKSVVSDEGLTQEQLREKYAHLPTLDASDGDGDMPKTPVGDSRAGETTGVDDDTSDESIDMDDDLGSSDMDSGSEDDDEASGDGAEDQDDEDDDGDAPSNLLGLFFGKSELKKLNKQAQSPVHETSEQAEAAAEAPEDQDLALPNTKVNGVNGTQPAGGINGHDALSVTNTSTPPPNALTDGAIGESLAAAAADDGAEPQSAIGSAAHDLSTQAVHAPSPLDQDTLLDSDKDAVDLVVPPQFSPLTECQDEPPDLSPEASIAADGTIDPPVMGTLQPSDIMMTDALPTMSAHPMKAEGAVVPATADGIRPRTTRLYAPPASQTLDFQEVATTNGTLEHRPQTTVTHDGGVMDSSPKVNATLMDAPVDNGAEPATRLPDVEITAPDSSTKAASPETDANTNNAISRDPSQSPRTTDTKPSEIDTVTSPVEPPGAQKELSRSASPHPSAANAPKTEIPFLLRGTLREYQHYGLDWLAGLYVNNTNGILADEMGLGKTIQTISLLAHLACQHEVWGPHLVIVPTSVMLNWEMEFKKWCPGFKILTYYGNQEERKRKRQGWTNDDVWNVCITSYQMVLQDQQVFRRRRWHYMILDEAHNIKNFKSQRWQTLLGFNTQARLLLTGTPLQNNLTELWSLLFFLMPSENGVGGFADLNEFHDWFGRPESQILESGREQMDDEARAIISKLHKVLRPYLLRRLKADVEKQMPAKYEHVELCRLSKRQRELYDGFLSRSDTRETLASGNYLSIINCLMQLRKVCNHPDLFVDRPIMTSFRMQSSVPARFEPMERLLRDKMFGQHPLSSVSLEFMNLVPTRHERFSDGFAASVAQYSSHRVLCDLKEKQKARAQNAFMPLDPSTVESSLIYLESASRWRRFEELQHCVYLNALRRQQRPIYGTRLVELLTIGVHERPFKPKPKVPKKIMEWFENDSFLLHNAVQTLDRRADAMEMTITKFACVTPAVVTRDLTPLLLGRKGVEAFEEADLKLSAPIKKLPFMPPERPHDPWHEARMRLSIQFPDKRLLQYDCGKLQALDRLLRKLQSGGHRALIFTQMTKVLDILEQFLNIHGHKYLRLDGATKVEQRQILTDRFNHDNRILCFILSTRSGGLGINLTGADTVIFYDQDWNPAMDKQCQDRCHRIGQTRDVHIYRLVSEHTIEANILRKASQKQMLDDVVIQEGEFTTDYFNKISIRDVMKDGDNGNPILAQGDEAANAAMDRVLGGVESTDTRTAGRVLERAEDREDVDAARHEKPQNPASGAPSTRAGTPRDGTPAASNIFSDLAGDGNTASEAAAAAEPVEVEHNAWGEQIRTVDDYMLGFMAAQLEGTPLELPKDKKKSKKKGKDTRKR